MTIDMIDSLREMADELGIHLVNRVLDGSGRRDGAPAQD